MLWRKVRKQLPTNSGWMPEGYVNGVSRSQRLTALKKHGKARRKRSEGAGHKADDDDLEEAVFE